MTPLPPNFVTKIRYDTVTSCWFWTAHKDKQGYGRFKYRNKPCRAHRFAYEWKYGLILPGFLLIHKCYQPSCVNPDHMFIGGKYENAMHRNARPGGYWDRCKQRRELEKLFGPKVAVVKELNEDPFELVIECTDEGTALLTGIVSSLKEEEEHELRNCN